MSPVSNRLHTWQRGWLAAALAAAAVLPLAACKPGTLGPSKDFTQIDYAHGGVVTGVVQYAETPPKPVEIDMAQDPVCAMSPTSMFDDYVVHDGGLANVMVYIESGLGNKAYPIPRQPAVMDQTGCRFEPHVIGAMVGQGVHFLNSDNTVHNVHMSPTHPGNNAFDVSQQAHADPVTRYFTSPETMIPVRCNSHPWMHAYVNILPNPFFAVTDAQGRFTIKGLPPGTYTLVAVHEKAGKQTATITVKADGTVQQGFKF
ncbi:carboxypeptidase regulatory-like domain-containing protein [Acidipila sp. EB88]|uniref:carboxypeptidase regulatory-like domain-containing protein n=1 Tax=Acidipila sp. EB88 TaxID=2305226 RepID=UPI000F5E6F84|nr:carboxypeptidase regulatory-like domain-containing protein [Acidipila sp. EB88]RRA48811.1 hypothetical protein D1Y84_11465 [Acidipila sp. EB88]